ncbi:hypothetical protein CHS0354_041337 [Potamilus streckersoni]|uniref:Uncharacterized protein n=1 Tax=Potamilus streckersoni TaxID=2493646 RepID=A0AAE0SE53_9BIVA|nr:hypothetical protein CHS0354_041337 [Potamilus streckersoni]
MAFARLACVVIVVGVLNQLSTAVSLTDMENLVSSLQAGYYTTVRPVTDQTKTVVVSSDLYLLGINDFDDSNQKLMTTAYLSISWNDEILASAWSSSPSIAEAYLPQNKVWLPDLALSNGFASLKGLGSTFIQVKLTYTSPTVTVTWRPYEVFETACAADVTYFPFDSTKCDIKFNYFVYDSTKVNITSGPEGVNLANYEENSDWTITRTSTSTFLRNGKSGIAYSITLKRKPLYYLLNIIFPIVLLALLNVIVFALPGSSREKTGYIVTMFLSFAIFLTIIAKELPTTSDKVSFFGIYVFLIAFQCTLIVLLTVLQIRFYNRNPDSRVPQYLKLLVHRMIRFQCGGYCIGPGEIFPYGKDPKKMSREYVTWPDKLT